MVKRILAMLMAVMMVWTVMPVEVWAAHATTDQRSSDGLYWYRVVDGENTVMITEYTGTDVNGVDQNVTALTVPAQINDMPVTQIAENAFQNSAKLQSVVFKCDLTSIGEGAFSGCKKLSSITIPDTVTSIGASAFEDCTKLTSITLPNNNKFTEIEARTFKGCKKLKTISIPETVTKIGLAAFANCTALESIDLPATLDSFGARVFYGCSKLGSISIPKGVTEIPTRMFYQCSVLKSIWIPKSVKLIAINAFESTPAFDTVKYEGTQEEWAGITIISTGNESLPTSGSKIIYNSSSITQTTGNTTNTTNGTTNGTTTSGDGTSAQSGGTTTQNGTTTPVTKAISACTITVAESSVTATGSEIKPAVTITDGTTTLVQNTDYTLTYTNNINAGTAGITITGKGNYTGTATRTFTITAARTSLANAIITLEYTTVSYDGKAKEPAVKSVVLSSSTLKATTDYKVTYSNNTNVGTATVTITGVGNYVDTATTNFKIETASIESASVTLETRSYKYDGNAKQPKVKLVKLGDNTLTENTDYTVSYKDNIEIGTATVTISGAGSYTGTLTRIFLILAENTSINNAGVTLDKTSYYYNGKAKKPTVKSVKLGDNVLTNGTDYTVSYKNNKNIGTGSVVITGKGGYTGTVTETFEIKAKTGTTFTSGTGKYKVTDNDAVTFTGLAKSTTKSLTIPDTAKYGGKSFEVTAIAAKALKGKGITKVVIKNNVSSIGASAFEGCKKLTSVKIGASVFEIGAKAFKNCKKLGTINIESEVLETVGSKALSGIKSNAKINVPDGQLEFYTELLKGKGQGSKVKIQ